MIGFYKYLIWLSVWEKREYHYMVIALFYRDRTKIHCNLVPNHVEGLILNLYSLMY